MMDYWILGRDNQVWEITEGRAPGDVEEPLNFLTRQVRAYDNFCSFTVLPLCDLMVCHSHKNWTWNEVHLVSITKPIIGSVGEKYIWESGIKLAVRESLQGETDPGPYRYNTTQNVSEGM